MICCIEYLSLFDCDISIITIQTTGPLNETPFFINFIPIHRNDPPRRTGLP
jgi:hypothetical protein